MRRVVSFLVTLPLIMLLSGCFLDTVIDSKGAGTMVVKIRLTGEAQLEPNKKRFESSSVKVTSATLDKDKWATYTLQFDDITKLNTVATFQNTTVKLTDTEGAAKTLTVKHVNNTTNKLPEEMVAYFGNQVRLSLTVPGEIITTNATSKADKTATWTYPLNDFTMSPEINLNVTFKAGDGGTPAQAAPKS
jgi:hypothetical protein